MPADQLQATLLAILDDALGLSGASMGLVQLFNPIYRGLEVVAQRGFKGEFLREIRLVRAGDQSSYARALRLAQRVVIPDIGADPYLGAFATVAKEAGFQSVQSMPIFAPDGRVIGVLSIHFSEVRAGTRELAAELALRAARASAAIDRIPIVRGISSPS
jgi:GAF domain-containing protein